MKISMSYADSHAFLEADAFELLEVGCLYFPRVTGFFSTFTPLAYGKHSFDRAILIATVSAYIREFVARD